MKKEKTSLIVHLVFIIFGIMCIIPFMMVVSASFSSEMDLAKYGFTVLPKNFTLDAYKYLFENPESIINGYKITIFITVVATVLAVIINSMAAYVLARPSCKFRTFLTWYMYFPTLFSGGLVAHYIINTQYLHLTDSILVLFIDALVGPFYVFMLRTNFKQLPAGLFDAAKIDGAGEFRIYLSIAMRLSKPSLATIAFLYAKGKWDSWYPCMLYIRSEEKYTLQYLLQRMMMNIQELLDMMDKVPQLVNVQDIPGENLRMALLCVAIGPMMLIFPFFQKYFTKGMVVGSVKG